MTMLGCSVTVIVTGILFRNIIMILSCLLLDPYEIPILT